MNILRTAATRAFLWYLVFFLIVLSLSSYGQTLHSPNVYYFGDERDNWWYLPNLLTIFLITSLVPIPHVLISLFFKSKRNLNSILGITKAWYKSSIVFIAILFIGAALWIIFKMLSR